MSLRLLFTILLTSQLHFSTAFPFGISRARNPLGSSSRRSGGRRGSNPFERTPLKAAAGDSSFFNVDGEQRLKGLELLNIEDLEDDEKGRRLLGFIERLVEGAMSGQGPRFPEGSPFSNINLDMARVRSGEDGSKQYRLTQAFKGVRVYGLEVNFQKMEGGQKEIKDRKTGRVIGTRKVEAGKIFSGVMAQNINFSVPTNINNIDPRTLLSKFKNREAGRNMRFRDDLSDVVLFLDPESGGLKVGLEMRYMAQEADYTKANRPHRIIDPFTEEVIWEYESLATQDIVQIGSGPGGNPKSGRHEFGKDYPKIRLKKVGDRCYYETEFVKTIKLTGEGANEEEAYSIECTDDSALNEGEVVNDGYSPINDGHFFLDQVFKMFEEWYEERPLGEEQVVLKVHGPNKDQAEWNGEELVIYNGDSMFHPLTSLDVMAHELGHGVTERCAGLEYRDQSGGMNEAFSDMTGKAAEFYLRGADKVDWRVGLEIFKGAEKGIRYMDAPAKDGKSIEHVEDFEEGMDVHYSSGIYNKVFHCLAGASTWGIQTAFDMFYVANCNFWNSRTNMRKGSQDALRSMAEMKNDGRYLSYDYSKVDIDEAIDCFKEVGINCKHKKNNKYKCKLDD